MQVFGASFDGPAANRKFAEAEGFPFPLLCDTTRAMGMSFGTCSSARTRWSARYTFAVDAAGKIELAIDTVHPARQAQELLGLLGS